MAGITQIVKAGEESIFHTRQQHTIKVAQVGRRLAEALIGQDREIAPVMDPEVVEAACLIHDLGHPPFGHAGEKILNMLVTGQSDGFEGNAQSFRIICKLAVHKEETPGLKLTRATLAATLKYPWRRGEEGTERRAKWSAYESETAEFDFAMEHQAKGVRTIEAALMDWADDIAYSVHDLEDFHRCSAIPWLSVFEGGKADLLSHITDDAASDLDRCYDALKAAIWDTFGETLRQRYEGTRDQRWVLRNMTSSLIHRYVSATTVTRGDTGYVLSIPAQIKGQIAILKQITRDHVIKSPSLAAQQVGYNKIIEGLYAAFLNEPEDRMPPFTPVRLQSLWALRGNSRARFAADCVAATVRTGSGRPVRSPERHQQRIGARPDRPVGRIDIQRSRTMTAARSTKPVKWTARLAAAAKH